METTYVSINRGMDEEDMVRVHNGILLSHRRSEVSQKDKDQYSILTHIYGILKDDNDNPI